MLKDKIKKKTIKIIKCINPDNIFTLRFSFSTSHLPVSSHAVLRIR
jgi:hypothetical protein